MTRWLAIGIGCRRGVAAEAVVALVESARRRCEAGLPARLFTIDAKRDEPALTAAAERLGLGLAFLPAAALSAVGEGVATRSAASAARFGTPSVSEAAALSGAGAGGRLVVRRIAEGGATCAVALAGEDRP